MGGRIRDLRARTGLTQGDLAAAADVSHPFVSLIESGQRSPSAAALRRIAGVLGTTYDYLHGGPDHPGEVGVREAIAAAVTALGNGEPADAEQVFARIDPASVSHLNRVAYLRTGAQIRDAVGQVDEALTWFATALDEARLGGTAHEVAELGMWLVGAHLDTGAVNGAVAAAELILDEVETLGIDGSDEHLRLAATYIWALVERGDYTYARARVRQYTELADEVGTPRGRGSVAWNAALIAQEKGGDDAAALALARKALAAMLEAGSVKDVARLRYDYATILLKCGTPHPREALEQLTLAREDLRRFGSIVEAARCDVEEGRARLLLGETDTAERLVTRGLTELTSTGTLNLDTCTAFTVLGDVAVARGDQLTAEQRYSWAAEQLSAMSATWRAGAVWAQLGRRLHAVGQTAAAIIAYRNALDELRVPAGIPSFVAPATCDGADGDVPPVEAA